ncbi:MAG: prolyl-tRNA synthetase associated domain-containing protein [Caldilineaceae bacterium]
MDIYAFLDQHDIPYTRVDHPPVYTVAEAEAKVPPLPGANLKNLLCATRRIVYWLVVVPYETQVDLQGSAAVLGEKRLSLASPERLMQHLGVEPGAVSLLAVVNDTAAAVEVIVDADLWQAELLKCHPLVNTSTLALRQSTWPACST